MVRPVREHRYQYRGRPGEVLKLKWEDIHEDEIVFPGEITKNGKTRHIPISDDLADELQHYNVDEQREGSIFPVKS